MPELPEVETTRRGIEPHVCGQQIERVHVRQRSLRWPVPRNLNALLKGKQFFSVSRRGKYLLLKAGAGKTESGTLLIHLGMSGHLKIIPAEQPAEKHDHVDIQFNNGRLLRYTDPRRFGAILWITGDPLQHKLLGQLGPEPLEEVFQGSHIYRKSRGRKQAVKTFVMDSKIVVGVGNIYANEALFLAGIRPARAAGTLSQSQCDRLAESIKVGLSRAISAGGTTLRDFVSAQGQAGYFSQQLLVYGRAGEPCKQCNRSLKELRLAQRATVYCAYCQK